MSPRGPRLHLGTLATALILSALAIAASAPLASAQTSDIAVSKSGPPLALADTDVSHTIIVTNLGPDDSATVTLTDPVTGGWSFVSVTQQPSGPAFSCSDPGVGAFSGSVVCTIASMASGATAQFTITFHIPPGTPPGTVFTNIATSSCATDPNAENDSGVAVTSTPPPPQADMVISKTGPGFAEPDTDAPYTITITNGGPDTGTSVTWVDTLPAPMTFVSLAPTGGPAMSCTTPSVGSGGTVSCSAASFAAGASATFTLTGHIPAGTPTGTTLQNTASVSAATADPNTENNTSTTGTTVALPPTITKAFGAASVPLNGTTSLTFTLSNPDAGRPLTGVAFSDTLPAGLVVATPNGLTGSCGGGTITAVAGASSVSLSGATLAASASCTFAVNVTGTSAGVKNNTTGAVTSTEGGTGGTASATLTVVAPPTISKAFGVVAIPLNGTTSLTFTLTNPNATLSLTGVGFVDTLPAGLVVATPSGLTGACGGGTITAAGGSSAVSLSGATLAAGASCTFAVNVTGTSLGLKLNTTGAVTSTEGGPGGTASASLTVNNLVLVTGADAGGGAHVRLFDARTRQERLGFLAYDPAFVGGARVAVADLNGDGTPDVITGAGPGGGPEVRVFDGATGAPFPGVLGGFFAFDPGFRGGVYVAVGNCDGTPRVIVGAGDGGGPQVMVFSGQDGTLLASFFAYGAGFRGGVRVATGDVNGDGCDDIVTGAGPGGGPHVQVFSGRDLSVLASFMAYDPAFTGGVYVAAGDVTGDGVADIITGAGAGGGPHVKVFSGQDGSLQQSFLAFDPGFPGGVRVGAVDLNGDGRADIIAGAGPGGGPEVRVFSGADGTVLWDFFAYDPAFHGGVFVGGSR